MREYVIHIDGACRGNGTSDSRSSAAYVISADGQQVEALGHELEIGLTNNAAEYEALISALEAMQFYEDAACITVYSDSLLVVGQMRGEYQVGPINLERHEYAKALLASLPRIEFVHGPRGKNALADRLCN